MIDSREVTLIKKAIRGRLQATNLDTIYYPKKNKNKKVNKLTNTKRKQIVQLLQACKSATHIKNQVVTSLSTIYKIKSQEKREYMDKMGWNKNTPDSMFPMWLRDSRRK